MNRLKFILSFLTLSLFWGGSFLAIRYSVEGFGSNFAAFLRILTAWVLLFLVFIRRLPKIARSDFFHVVGAGLAGMAVPWIFLFWAEKTVAPALAALMNCCTTLFVVLISPFFNPKDKISVIQWVGVGLGFLGVAIIFWPELMRSELTLHFWGMLAILLMAFLYAISNQWQRRFSQRIDIRANGFYQLLGSAIFMLGVSLCLDSPLVLPTFSPSAVWAVLYLGIFSTGIAILLNYWIIKNVGGVESSAIVFLSPTVSIFLDWIILHKVLSTFQLLGGVVILVSLVFVNFKPWRHNKGSKQQKNSQNS